MKRLIILFSIACFCLPILGQGRVGVDLLELKEHNDTLRFAYNALIGPRAVETGQALRIIPSLESGDSITTLPGITILGHNRGQVMQRMGLLPGNFIRTGIQDTLLATSLRIPYELWMDSASLVITEELTGYRARTVTTRYRLRDNVELAPRTPYAVAPVVAFTVPEKEVKVRRRQGKAYLDFPVGRSVILPTYRRNPEELSKIDDAIRDVAGNPDVAIQGIYIEGYASPDGPYATNDRLSKARAEALKTYISDKFNLAGGLFRVTNVAEDWGGLVELVGASNLPQKDRVLQVIESVGIFDGREAALMRLDGGRPYRIMLKDMFPELRRVEYQVDYTVKDYELSQVLVVLENNPGDLSQSELYALAMSSEKESGNPGRLLIEVIPRYFPDDPVANCNAAAVLIQTGELATARRYLQKAGQSAAALNNTGVLHLLEGELEQAEACFTNARDQGCPQAGENLLQVAAKREDDKKQERYQKRR